MTTDMKSIVNNYNEARKAFEETLKTKTMEVFADFFKNNPEFRTIEWAQWTPGFCDGDPCRFTRGDIYYTLQPEFYDDESRETIEADEYDIRDLEDSTGFDPLYVVTDAYRNSSWGRERVVYWDLLTVTQQQERMRLNKIFDEMASTINSIPDDISEDVFGNDTHIRVDRNGITKSEYDCGY